MTISSSPPSQKIGLLGGTFDPIHSGHEFILKQAMDEFDFDCLLLCPAHQAPLRDYSPIFPPTQRLEMVSLIAKENPRTIVFDFEIKQKKTSYTWNTIQEVKKLYPNPKIYLLIGYDQFLQLPKWKFLRELSKEVHFVVFARGQSRPVPSLSFDLSFTLMNNSLICVSSTSIREKIQKGKSIKGMVPNAIHSYLQDNHLLTNSSII
jgi:nicotinate-nucleotide adenylyltransferase